MFFKKFFPPSYEKHEMEKRTKYIILALAKLA